MDEADLDHWFAHHPPRDDAVVRTHEFVRLRCRNLARELNRVLPDSDEKKLALRAVDRACMHANAAVARVANYVTRDEPRDV